MNTKKVKGFTLIELMVVVAIIAILAAIAIPMIFQYRLSANRAKCVGNMKQIQNAVESRKAAKANSTSTDVETELSSTVYVNSNGSAYFKTEPKCPEGNKSYSLSTANQPSWAPTCENYGDPYLHTFN